MLTFEETSEHFVIKETILGWFSESIKIVRWTKDLKMKQINDDSWKKTAKGDREWFEKCYRKHFKGGFNG